MYILKLVLLIFHNYLSFMMMFTCYFSTYDSHEHFNCSAVSIYFIEAEWRIYALVNLAIIGSDNGLSPGRCQAITWTNDGILLIGPLGTNFNEILMEIHKFLFKNMHLKMSSGKWRPFCLSLNVIFQKQLKLINFNLFPPIPWRLIQNT